MTQREAEILERARHEFGTVEVQGKEYFELDGEGLINFVEALSQPQQEPIVNVGTKGHCDWAVPQQEPVARIVRNESGQITMQMPDGSYFDISKFVGANFYTSPPSTEALEAKVKQLEEIRTNLKGLNREMCANLGEAHDQVAELTKQNQSLVDDVEILTAKLDKAREALIDICSTDYEGECDSGYPANFVASKALEELAK